MQLSCKVKALFVSYLIFMSIYQGDCRWLGPDAIKFDYVRRTVVPKSKTNVDLNNLSPDGAVIRVYIGKSKNEENDSDMFLRLS